MLVLGPAALFFAILMSVKIVRAMARGAPYRFGPIDGGLFISGEEYSPYAVLACVAAVVGSAAGLTAWSLQLSDWLHTPSNACRRVITRSELEELLGRRLDGTWPKDTPDFMREDRNSRVGCRAIHKARDGKDTVDVDITSAPREPADGRAPFRISENEWSWRVEVPFERGPVATVTLTKSGAVSQEALARVGEIVSGRKELLRAYRERPWFDVQRERRQAKWINAAAGGLTFLLYACVVIAVSRVLRLTSSGGRSSPTEHPAPH